MPSLLSVTLQVAPHFGGGKLFSKFPAFLRQQRRVLGLIHSKVGSLQCTSEQHYELAAFLLRSLQVRWSGRSTLPAAPVSADAHPTAGTRNRGLGGVLQRVLCLLELAAQVGVGVQGALLRERATMDYFGAQDDAEVCLGRELALRLHELQQHAEFTQGHQLHSPISL